MHCPTAAAARPAPRAPGTGYSAATGLEAEGPLCPDGDPSPAPAGGSPRPMCAGARTRQSMSSVEYQGWGWSEAWAFREALKGVLRDAEAGMGAGREARARSGGEGYGGGGGGAGLCLVILGGGGQIGPPGFWLTHPPTHIRKFFLRKKMKFIKGARTWRSILGTQTFFCPLTHPPPPPRYSINQPLSKGLGGGGQTSSWDNFVKGKLRHPQPSVPCGQSVV